MAILRVLPIIIILLLTTNCGGGSSGGGGATPSETENTDGTNGDNTPDNNPSDEEQGDASISGTITYGDLAMSNTNINKLYVIACEPEFDNASRFKGCLDFNMIPVNEFYWDISMWMAEWEIPNLKSGTGYIIHLIFDSNDNEAWDIKTDLVLAGPAVYNAAEPVVAPYSGINLNYDPVVPVNLQ